MFGVVAGLREPFSADGCPHPGVLTRGLPRPY